MRKLHPQTNPSFRPSERLQLSIKNPPRATKLRMSNMQVGGVRIVLVPDLGVLEHKIQVQKVQIWVQRSE